MNEQKFIRRKKGEGLITDWEALKAEKERRHISWTQMSNALGRGRNYLNQEKTRQLGITPREAEILERIYGIKKERYTREPVYTEPDRVEPEEFTEAQEEEQTQAKGVTLSEEARFGMLIGFLLSEDFYNEAIQESKTGRLDLRHLNDLLALAYSYWGRTTR